MEIVLSEKPTNRNPVLLYHYASKKKPAVLLSEVEKELQTFIEVFLKEKITEDTKANELPLLHVFHPAAGTVTLLPDSEFKTLHLAATVGAKTAKALGNAKITKAEVIFPTGKFTKETVLSYLTGFSKGNYSITKKTSGKKQEKLLKTITLIGAKDLDKADVKTIEVIAAAIHSARDIQNTPGNLFRPEDFTHQAKQIAKGTEMKVRVFDESTFEKMGMGCFYAVAKGSAETAYLTEMVYRGGKEDEKPVMLVGKGLTFDSGGYSLKPAGSMEDMKFDKCGGAVVLAVMDAVARLKLKVNVVGLIAASENLINGKAMKPGDIFTACNGKTVEVLNTDAEGRLILCDSIAYGIKTHQPTTVIDVATLTGACMVALGSYNAGLFSSDDRLSQELTDAGQHTGEFVWRMPMNPEYKKDLESSYADLKNVGGRAGGAITAAWFLREFTDNVPWAHLDIAGVMSDIKHVDTFPAKGASGFGVHLLIQFLQNKATTKSTK